MSSPLAAVPLSIASDGSALMSLYLFRAEAEPSVSHQSLALFDHIIADTAERLKKISDLETVAESRMSAGMGIEYQSSPHDLPKYPLHG